MNVCNLRGFLIASENKMGVIKKIKGSVTRTDRGYCFFFNESFDLFQNCLVTNTNTNSCSEHNIYLRNDELNWNIFLGTNFYTIFPNTCVPLSYPFFSYRAKHSYLYIECDPDQNLDNTPNFILTYDGGVLHKSLKTSYDSRDSFDYHSIIPFNNFANSHMYKKPVIANIIY